MNWSDDEVALLRRLKSEGTPLTRCLHLFPGRSLQALYEKSKKLEDVIIDLTFDPKATEKAVPSVYRYTRHSGKCFSDKITRERPKTLGANVTARLMGDPPVGQKLHGFQAGQSNHGETNDLRYTAWHL